MGNEHAQLYSQHKMYVNIYHYITTIIRCIHKYFLKKKNTLFKRVTNKGNFQINNVRMYNTRHHILM